MAGFFLPYRVIVGIVVLYSVSSGNEFLVLPVQKFDAHHYILLEEARKRGYRMCFKHNFLGRIRGRTVCFFDRKDATHISDKYFLSTAIGDPDPFHEVIYFKTTRTLEVIGIGFQDVMAERFGIIAPTSRFIFRAHCEAVRYTHGDEVKDFEKDSKKGDGASSSGYGTQSTHSRVTKSENLEAESTSEVETMVSGKTVYGIDLAKEIERAAQLRIMVSSGQECDEGYVKVQAWLETAEMRSGLPDILTTEDLDREFGNISEKIIGPEGGTMTLRSYQIRIPPNAVKAETKFKFRISLEIDELELPEDLILISLPLHCSPGNLEFDSPVSMTIPTWVRKAEFTPDSPPIDVYTYQKREGEDWRCVKSTQLTSTGMIDFDLEHFCIEAQFIKKSDVGRVKFALEHILFKDNLGTYTSCHFFASDAFASSMLEYLKQNYEVVHPPTYTSLVREGEEIKVDIVSGDREKYQFQSQDSCTFKIDEDFYKMNRRESISFVLTFEAIRPSIIEFTYVIGEKKFLRRDRVNHTGGKEDNGAVGDEEGSNSPGVDASSGGSVTSAEGVKLAGANSSMKMEDSASLHVRSGNDTKGNTIILGLFSFVSMVAGRNIGPNAGASTSRV